VLTAAKLETFFDIRVDSNTILAEHLAGKPAPDTLLMAAKLLGVEPSRAVVIEDALSGVAALTVAFFIERHGSSSSPRVVAPLYHPARSCASLRRCIAEAHL
jgi:FMN phosphatase YigB (HAD superfamily)